MPQGDDFLTADAPALAAVPVDDPPDPAASAPVVDDGAASAPVDPEPPPPIETPEQLQRKNDRAFAALRRERDAERVLSASLQKRLDAQQAPRPAPPAPPVPLTPEQFVQATAAAEAAKAVQHYVATQDALAVQTAWQAQETTLRATHDDYDDVIAELQTPFPTAVLQALQAAPDGAALAYHLATHPEDAARLDGRTVSAATALRELGKLEARLATASSPTPPPVVPKPRPLTPIQSAGAGPDTRDPDALPYDEYTAWYKRTYGTR